MGRSRGGLTTKIHALVEALGNLARWHLTPGQAADVSEAASLLEDVAADAVVADKAYDAQSLIDTITATGAQAVIPPRANRIQPRTLTAIFTRRVTWSNASSAVSSTFAESPHDMISSINAMRRSLPSPQRGSGSLNVNTT
jgi:transposase